MGLVVSFESGGELIGTLRALPMNLSLAPCEEMFGASGQLPAQLLDNAWEVGRVVLSAEHRAGPEMIRRCLFLALTHLLQERSAVNLFASCNRMLARLYRRFGFSQLSGGAEPSGENSFCLIHGLVDHVVFALAASEAERTVAARVLAAAGLAAELP